MRTKFKKGDKISIKKRFEEMQLLLKPFIKKYHQPVLVHATPSSVLFKKILDEGKLRIPNIENAELEHSFIEKMLKIYPCIFFSLGFAYASAYDFKYSLIFDLEYIKNSDYYRNSISYQAYKAIVQYWDKNSPEYLEKLAKKSKICRKVDDKFYNDEYRGKKHVLFDFWKAEKETFELIQEYSKKTELLKIVKEIINNKYVPYPASKKIALVDCFNDVVPEIVVKKDISLLENKYLLGFYIRGKIPHGIKSLLIREYPNKILFDGKKIISIDKMKSFNQEEPRNLKNLYTSLSSINHGKKGPNS